ncbi:hypothetical protein ACU4GR_03385 [Methylobacterium oryzae CBMB20]
MTRRLLSDAVLVALALGLGAAQALAQQAPRAPARPAPTGAPRTGGAGRR